jgi:hypothetical protein
MSSQNYVLRGFEKTSRHFFYVISYGTDINVISKTRLDAFMVDVSLTRFFEMNCRVQEVSGAVKL